MNDKAAFLPSNARQITITNDDINLDTLVLLPKSNILGIAIIFHPDPKAGGTNTNKVVQTIAKVMNSQNYICYCPNLRGVAKSSGIHDFGRGEVSDGQAVLAYAKQLHGYDLPIVLAGFSFGSAIAAKLAQLTDGFTQLILVGPAVSRYDVPITKPSQSLVIHGQDDEIIPLNDVLDWSKQYPKLLLQIVPECGHFFHGKLVLLQNILLDNLKL